MTGPEVLDLPLASATRADLPPVDAQPTTQGKFMTLGPVVAQGVIVQFGDSQENTGPIDIIAVSPEGVMTTLLADYATESTANGRLLNNTVWMPSIDPTGANPGSLATNHGGTWHAVEVSIDGLPAVQHLYDVTVDPDSGDLLACGAHAPDTAFVWRSTDHGATWTADLAYPSGEVDGSNRFYGFRRAGGKPVVVSSYDEQRFQLDGGDWVEVGSAVYEETRLVWASGTLLYHHTRGFIGVLPAGIWTASPAPDGSTWACDGESIYLMPPPN